MKRINTITKKTKTTYYSLVFLIISICITFISYAQPGTLDYQFGNGGKVFFENFKGQPNVLTIQRDGKIVISGDYASTYSQHISRFNPDGSIDESFGATGHVIIFNVDGSSIGTINTILIQSDGRILVGGRFMTGSGSSNADIGLLRLNSNGVLDSSFGVNGIVLIKLSDGYDKLGEIALQPDGKILVAGTKEAISEEYYPFFIARLNTDGSYDAGFANQGVRLLDYHGRSIKISSVLVLADNNIIIAGDELSADYYYQAVVFKFNTDGSLDEGFGTNGFFETRFSRYSFGSSVVQDVHDIMLMPDGKLLLTGNAYGENRYTTVFLCRVNANGTLDENFGNGKGFVLPSFPVTLSRGYQSFFVRDNKILVTGYYRNSNGRDDGFAAFRFNENGNLDSSFGIDGKAVYGFDNLWAGSGPRGGAVQPNGRIILGGFAYPEDDEDYPRIVMIGLQGDDGVSPANYTMYG